VNLPYVFDDSLGDIPLGLQSPHRASCLLNEMLDPRELGKDVIDHRFLLADAVECDVHIAEDVHDRVRLTLHIIDELTATLDCHDLFLGSREILSQPLHLARGPRNLRPALGDGSQVGLALLAKHVDTFDSPPNGFDHLLALRNGLHPALHVIREPMQFAHASVHMA